MLIIEVLNGIPVTLVNQSIGNSRSQHEPNLQWAVHACAVKNDELAKEFIYKKMYGYVTVVVSRYIKSTHDAEELVNETFIKAFKAIHKFSYSEKNEEKMENFFYGWLGRIAANLSIDHLRSKRQFHAGDDTVEDQLLMVPVSPSTELEVADIMSLLDKLPSIQRAIFNLYELEGYSHEEIAKKLNIPESTSRTYLTRGKQKLRKLYKQLMFDEKKK
ncbi:RNA polymerase sigma factor [Albibacterium indicum]|uniref:RNA polymerase sigma factor n=1 Tax=Albibacterium indicum TaxID=2292082 RepID=UPI001FE73FE8|nr:RNA polymerase sigma factor [Pedobacter indicus]